MKGVSFEISKRTFHNRYWGTGMEIAAKMTDVREDLSNCGEHRPFEIRLYA